MAFTPIFGDAPHARVLDYLLSQGAMDRTMTEIARGASVARPTAYKVVEDLIGAGLLRETRTVGKSRFFALDANEPAVVELARVAPVLERRMTR